MVSVHPSLALAVSSLLTLGACNDKRVDLILVSAQPADTDNGRLVVVEAETDLRAKLRVHVTNGTAQWADSEEAAGPVLCVTFEKQIERQLIVRTDGEAIVAAALATTDDEDDETSTEESACEAFASPGAADTLLVSVPTTARDEGGAPSAGGAAGAGGTGGTGGAQ